jgi:hypothetical protein
MRTSTQEKAKAAVASTRVSHKEVMSRVPWGAVVCSDQPATEIDMKRLYIPRGIGSATSVRTQKILPAMSSSLDSTRSKVTAASTTQVSCTSSDAKYRTPERCIQGRVAFVNITFGASTIDPTISPEDTLAAANMNCDLTMYLDIVSVRLICLRLVQARQLTGLLRFFFVL